MHPERIMTTQQTLLVPLDGSEIGEAALPWATCLGRARGLSLVLVQVVHWPAFTMNGMSGGYLTPEAYEQILTAERESAAAYLEEVRQRLQTVGLSAETSVRVGDTVESLLDLADETEPYAIIMATHGRGGLKRLALGSVAEGVIQRATVPVLLIRARAAQPAMEPSLRHLLVPLDGSPLAERALDVAAEIAPNDAELALVTVRARSCRAVEGGEGIAMVEDTETTRRAVRQAEEYLTRVAESLDRTRWSVRTGVRVSASENENADEILGAARAQPTDLIVMSTHGLTGPARWFLGSVADRVVRNSEQPVLLISVRALAARVAGSFTVRDVMTSEPATVRDDESLLVAIRKLLRRRISGAPVVNADGDLVGVISEHDLIEWQARLADSLVRSESLAPDEYARRLEGEPVSRVMAHPAVSVEDTAPLSAAIRLFRERRLRRLPVTRHGKLVGIVTRADVLRAMASQWQSTNSGSAAID
jgi:nucleotide-binding universal stress UspA family protein/predicted transcriptional regulator